MCVSVGGWGWGVAEGNSTRCVGGWWQGMGAGDGRGVEGGRHTASIKPPTFMACPYDTGSSLLWEKFAGVDFIYMYIICCEKVSGLEVNA